MALKRTTMLSRPQAMEIWKISKHWATSSFKWRYRSKILPNMKKCEWKVKKGKKMRRREEGTKKLLLLRQITRWMRPNFWTRWDLGITRRSTWQLLQKTSIKRTNNLTSLRLRLRRERDLKRPKLEVRVRRVLPLTTRKLPKLKIQRLTGVPNEEPRETNWGTSSSAISPIKRFGWLPRKSLNSTKLP